MVIQTSKTPPGGTGGVSRDLLGGWSHEPINLIDRSAQFLIAVLDPNSLAARHLGFQYLANLLAADAVEGLAA